MSLEMKSESTLFSCKLFTVKRISVSLPNGLVKNYELVDIFTGETKIVFFITKMNLKDDLLHLRVVNLHLELYYV